MTEKRWFLDAVTLSTNIETFSVTFATAILLQTPDPSAWSVNLTGTNLSQELTNRRFKATLTSQFGLTLTGEARLHIFATNPQSAALYGTSVLADRQ